MISKHNIVRLNYTKELNNRIHERDKHHCIYCHKWVDENVKWHHERIPGLKSDTEEQGVLLCPECHFIRHNKADGKTIRDFCRKYLEKMYGKDRN